MDSSTPAFTPIPTATPTAGFAVTDPDAAPAMAPVSPPTELHPASRSKLADVARYIHRFTGANPSARLLALPTPSSTAYRFDRLKLHRTRSPAVHLCRFDRVQQRFPCTPVCLH